jgi:hypothetical protein
LDIGDGKHDGKCKMCHIPGLVVFFYNINYGSNNWTIIIVVAVLLSHMLNNPVASMNPRMIRLPLVPVMFTILNAIRLCKFHFSMARPIMNPPINKKITGLA